MFVQTGLSDGRIGLRRYEPGDVDALFQAARESVGQLSLWMPWCSPTYSREESQAFVDSREQDWARKEHYSFVIYDVASGAFLGGAGFNYINHVHRVANLGYWVRTSQIGKGVATAAVRLVARFGLVELAFNRLVILVATGNLASQRVAEKAGARREGVLRKALILQGQTHDAVLFSLLMEDLNG